MDQLLRYSLPDNASVVIEVDDGRSGGGTPVAIADRLKNTGQALKDALSALPLLLREVKETVLDEISSPSEVSIEFGAKIGGDIGLIVSKTTAEANFKIKVTWKVQ